MASTPKTNAPTKPAAHQATLNWCWKPRSNSTASTAGDIPCDVPSIRLSVHQTPPSRAFESLPEAFRSAHRNRRVRFPRISATCRGHLACAGLGWARGVFAENLQAAGEQAIVTTSSSHLSAEEVNMYMDACIHTRAQLRTRATSHTPRPLYSTTHNAHAENPVRTHTHAHKQCRALVDSGSHRSAACGAAAGGAVGSSGPVPTGHQR